MEEAKQIFYNCLGSHVSIDRNFGDYYKKFNVPIEIENEWKQNILNDLKKKVNAENAYPKIKAAEAYVQLIDATEAVTFLIDILKNAVLDTFSVILILENLKRYMLHYKTYHLSVENAVFIKQTIEKYKTIIMTQKIKIDDSYKKLSFMKNYDFSNENVLRRIKLL